MKIIAKTGERGAEYIAIVSHTELEKLTDKYYGKLIELKVGEALDLGTGHDFRGADPFRLRKDDICNECIRASARHAHEICPDGWRSSK